MLVPVLMYSNETRLWKEKERFRIKAIQMDNLRGLLGIRSMDRILNAWKGELCRVKNGLDERIDECMLGWFRYLERDRIAKRVYVGGFTVSRSLGGPQKRWIDTMEECLKKRGLDVRQPRRMGKDRSEWWGFVRGNAWGVAQGMNP